ncbi:MAG TPA: aldose 1-epimerase [Allosphingosinicella sp.]|jgi:aldose 1-epimerase|nr:aldose 1-epimerase [Allosphingosinicella sp.]
MEPDSRPTLSSGPLALRLAPALGGGIADLECCAVSGEKIKIFRPYKEDESSPTALASFPLVPFVNRVRGGAFSFRGRRVTLERNMPPDPSPLHGQGWLNPWRVERLGAAHAELLYFHSAGEWPWDYEARQTFDLDENGLSLVLACTNRSDGPMPCGLGQHPYFLCTPATRLDTGVETVWTIDEQILPVEQVPAVGRFDLADRLVCGQGLDHGFGGWNGRAVIADPELPFRIAMSSPDAAFFQLYSPASGGLFVAEPVTHANAAMNAPEEEWAELGLRVLEPGETMSLTMRVEMLPL